MCNFLSCCLFQTLGEKKKRLSGYGVELAIKSTEYKAKDDTKVQGNKIEKIFFVAYCPVGHINLFLCILKKEKRGPRPYCHVYWIYILL